MASTRTVHRVASVPVTTGTKRRQKPPQSLPTRAEVRALSRRINASDRYGRRGRPGRIDCPAFWAHVTARLVAAAKAGRGLHYLSRDEVDAVSRRLGLLNATDDGHVAEAAQPPKT